MDDQLLDAICERLISSLSTQGTYIFQEDDPVDEMLFIIRGTLESSTTNGGRYGFFNSITLRPGDFCGEELLTWALLPNSTLNLPSSTRTVKALTEVEALTESSGNGAKVKNLGATVLASRFAANTKKGNNKIQDNDPVPQLFKPVENYFGLFATYANTLELFLSLPNPSVMSSSTNNTYMLLTWTPSEIQQILLLS
jgi:hypothetical protein